MDWRHALHLLKELSVVQTGDKVIVTRGDIQLAGGTNTMKIVTVN